MTSTSIKAISPPDLIGKAGIITCGLNEWLLNNFNIMAEGTILGETKAL